MPYSLLGVHLFVQLRLRKIALCNRVFSCSSEEFLALFAKIILDTDQVCIFTENTLFTQREISQYKTWTASWGLRKGYKL